MDPKTRKKIDDGLYELSQLVDNYEALAKWACEIGDTITDLDEPPAKLLEILSKCPA